MDFLSKLFFGSSNEKNPNTILERIPISQQITFVPDYIWELLVSTYFDFSVLHNLAKVCTCLHALFCHTLNLSGKYHIVLALGKSGYALTTGVQVTNKVLHGESQPAVEKNPPPRDENKLCISPYCRMPYHLVCRSGNYVTVANLILDHNIVSVATLKLESVEKRTWLGGTLVALSPPGVVFVYYTEAKVLACHVSKKSEKIKSAEKIDTTAFYPRESSLHPPQNLLQMHPGDRWKYTLEVDGKITKEFEFQIGMVNPTNFGRYDARTDGSDGLMILGNFFENNFLGIAIQIIPNQKKEMHFISASCQLDSTHTKFHGNFTATLEEWVYMGKVNCIKGIIHGCRIDNKD